MVCFSILRAPRSVRSYGVEESEREKEEEERRISLDKEVKGAVAVGERGKNGIWALSSFRKLLKFRDSL